MLTVPSPIKRDFECINRKPGRWRKVNLSGGMGSPIKRPLSRGKTYPGQEKFIFLSSLLQSYRHPHHCRNFYRFAVSAFTAPVTHQMKVSWALWSHQSCAAARPDRSRSGATWLLSRPFPLAADQKIFGSRPCPNDFYRSRGY